MRGVYIRHVVPRDKKIIIYIYIVIDQCSVLAKMWSGLMFVNVGG